MPTGRRIGKESPQSRERPKHRGTGSVRDSRSQRLGDGSYSSGGTAPERARARRVDVQQPCLNRENPRFPRMAEAEGDRTRRSGVVVVGGDMASGSAGSAGACVGVVGVTEQVAEADRESNPPGTFRPPTGFEDRGAHQALCRLRLGP